MAQPHAGKPPSQRQLRVGEELRHSLSAVLMRGEVRDPDLEGRSITVSEVRVSPDLRNATAFVLPLGGHVGAEDTAAVVQALRRAAPYLQHEVGRGLRMKFTPRLSFQPDTSYDAFSHIDTIMRGPSFLPDREPGDDAESDDGRVEDGGAEPGVTPTGLAGPGNGPRHDG